MRTLIDGFNLFHRWGVTAEFFGEGTSPESDVRRAMAHLADALPNRFRPCTVALDGGREPERTEMAELPAIWAGPDESADEVICRLLRTSDNAAAVTVITDDRALARQSLDFGGKVERLDVFLRSLASTPKKKGVKRRAAEPPKPPPPSSSEVAEWLDIFGDGEDIHDEEFDTNR